MRKLTVLLLAVLIGAATSQAATIFVKTRDGVELQVPYKRKTIRKHEIILDSGERIDLLDVASIHTDSFELTRRRSSGPPA